MKKNFRQLTVVKIDASFSYIVCFGETFKFTAREDEVSLGVYWFFRRNGMESGLPQAVAILRSPKNREHMLTLKSVPT